jgi:gliding motility-associated-like protein
MGLKPIAIFFVKIKISAYHSDIYDKMLKFTCPLIPKTSSVMKKKFTKNGHAWYVTKHQGNFKGFTLMLLYLFAGYLPLQAAVNDAKKTITTFRSTEKSAVLHNNANPGTRALVNAAPNGGGMPKYRRTIMWLSDNSNLKNLTVSSGRLTPVFAAGTLNYTDTVTVQSVTITPQGANPHATMRVNGVPVANNTASASLPLAMGNNIINTVVTSEDSSKVRTYTVNVVRIPKDALLANLEFSSGTLSPAFLPTAGIYKDTVSNVTPFITVTPVADPAYPAVTVKVNGISVAPGNASPAIALTVGNNRIITVVTSAGGTLTKTYTTMVTRLSSNPNLANIVISGVSLSPAFAAGTVVYTARVSYATSSINLTVTPANLKASIRPNWNYSEQPAGALVATRPLNVGVNLLGFTVISEDGTDRRFYKVSISRPSNNANLQQLTLSTGTLSPAFTAAGISYTASVPNATTSLKVTPTAANLNAYIKVNGTTVNTGTASPSLPLVVGSNTITTVVVSQDSSKTRTYTVTVNRAPSTFAFTPQSKTDISGRSDRPLIGETLPQPLIRQAVSPNGDGINDVLLIDGVESFADNTLKIMNRDGNLVFQKAKYDNISAGFDGHSGINGRQLPAGTYFYSLEYAAEDGKAKHKTGFFVLKY